MPPVRPGSRWVSAGAIVGVIGALTGALLCCFALWSVTAQNSALLGFERTQNQLTILDEQMTHWARLYAATGDERWQVRHEQGKAEIKSAFRQAVEMAPKMGLSGPMTQLTHADRMLAEIENQAVAKVKAGDRETAIAMLTSTEHQTYRSMFERSLDELHRGVQDILQERLAQSYWLFGIALFVGIGCSGALVLIWRQVGRYTMRQAVALEKARDALASHAASLEDRIAERTADLEKAKETAERADRAKSEFLAAMSHEIRTPLNGVLGMADALAKSPLNERQVRMIQVIQESGDTLLALLNDVLDLAKIESGKMELENTDFDVEEAVRSAEAIFTERAQEKGLSFSVLVNPAAKGWFVGDPTRLRQILYNLISNALKFTQRGEVKVVVDAVPRLDGQVTMSFAVSDTGIGISDEVRARLFQKFVQADASTTRTYGGTGLGLAICRDLVGMMGGVITVDSEVGKGSTFRFEVPVARGNAPMPSLGVADTLTRTDEGVDAPPLRILAADDNGHNRLVLKLMLEPLGLTPFFVENGREAVDAWQSQTFDLVLMDVQMPVLSGPDAAREIRALEALDGRPRTPIIALTANAMPQHVKECLESGMDAHVSKPIKPDNLFSTIHAVLDPSVPVEATKDGALAAA